MSRFVRALMLAAFAAGAVQAQTPPAEPEDTATATPQTAEPDNSIRSVSELLAKMSNHRRLLNYQGTFTHQDTIGSETFRLQHWVADGTEYQRLYYLQGPEREAVVSKGVDCRMMGEQLVARRAEQLAGKYPELEQFYSFRVLGMERIAGRPATVLHILPKDPFRFGYLFTIDRETGLVLKSIMLDESQRPVEQFQYVELAVGLPPEHFSDERGAQISHRVSAEQLAPCNPDAGDKPVDWQLNWAPEGFVFVGERQARNDVQMLMYTDGLSTFSVFLDPAVTEVAIEARAQRGATNFYLGGVRRQGRLYQLTVVGEIPAAVAERIGQSVAAKTEPDPAG